MGSAIEFGIDQKIYDLSMHLHVHLQTSLEAVANAVASWILVMRRLYRSPFVLAVLSFLFTLPGYKRWTKAQRTKIFMLWQKWIQNCITYRTWVAVCFSRIMAKVTRVLWIPKKIPDKKGRVRPNCLQLRVLRVKCKETVKCVSTSKVWSLWVLRVKCKEVTRATSIV